MLQLMMYGILRTPARLARFCSSNSKVLSMGQSRAFYDEARGNQRNVLTGRGHGGNVQTGL
jgi:hypothetical protein